MCVDVRDKNDLIRSGFLHNFVFESIITNEEKKSRINIARRSKKFIQEKVRQV